jgi:hypothetical protein
MTWRALIGDDVASFARMTLDVHLLDKWQGGYAILGPGGESRTVVTEPDASPLTTAPALRIPTDAAPALLAALSRHLGAVEHPEQLRRDYEAERARVDRFIQHLTRQGVAS